MKKYMLFLLFALAIATPKHANAWGKKGHQMVATIGFDLLDGGTQDIIKKYLGTISVPAAGTWMDDMRNNPQYAYLKPWHFINLEPGQNYQPNGEENVVNEINAAISNLRHRNQLTDVQIQFNILVLFHLIGDIAQPLHDGYGSDRGGNSVDVTYRGKSSNLHKVWDGDIIDGEGITADDCKALLSGITDEQKDGIKVLDPVVWMTQARSLLSKVYNYKNGTIDNGYISRNTTVIEKQVLYAGMRLAATLEDIFNAPETASVSDVGHAQFGLDTVILEHTYYRSTFVNSAHIPWVVEYTLHAEDVNCSNPLKRSNKFAPDPTDQEATNLNGDYTKSGYDRGHNMPAADNECHGTQAMTECFYFSNMFPQTHKLNAGVWKTLEEQERNMAAQDDSIYVWIGSYGTNGTIGKDKVVVPKYCWKVIYDYKTQEWSAYIFPNTKTVSGKPENFTTTVDDIRRKSGYDIR